MSRWGFVDYENTGGLEGIDIKSYGRLLIFCGPNNRKLKLGELSTTEFMTIELICIKTNGANNLDFHLAFYVGRYHEIAPADVEFHIISNDDGFDGIVEHINNIGRKCKKTRTREKVSVKKAERAKLMPPLGACAELIIAGLKQISGKKRPRKVKTLTNWIQSHCSHLETAENAGQIVDELASHALISVKDGDLSYRF